MQSGGYDHEPRLKRTDKAHDVLKDKVLLFDVIWENSFGSKVYPTCLCNTEVVITKQYEESSLLTPYLIRDRRSVWR